MDAPSPAQLVVTSAPELRVVGSDVAEWVGASLLDHVDAGERAEAARQLARAVDGAPCEVTLTFSGARASFRAGALHGERAALILTRRDERDVFLRAVIRTTQDAFVTMDRDGRVVEFNAAAERVFGWSREEMLGQRVERLMPPSHAHAHAGYVARYERTGEPHAIGRIRSVEAQRRDGTVFPIELSVTEIGDADGVRYGAFIRDVSEREALTDALVEKERLATIGETAATLAHEVGNPLNNMQLKAAVVERRLRTLGVEDPRAVDGVAAIRAEIERLGALLREFRDLARRPRLERIPFDVAEALREVAADLRPQAGDVTVRVEAAALTVEADRGKLRQVLLNLGLNALEALGGAGEVVLRAIDDDAGVRVEVADTGPGVADDIDPYEPFVSTKDGGSGLGLAVARRIVEAHGGELTHRAGETGGAVFVATLPR